MMKTSLMCITLLLGSALAVQNIYGNDYHGEGSIDWCRDNDYDECLCNKINIQGPKVVLINLDDHCLLDDIEDEGGIFLQTGDLLVVTGRSNTTAL
jgi:hypothetical protein